MDVFWSLLSVIVGIGAIIYSYKNIKPVNGNTWDTVMRFKGYIGGLFFIVIGIVTLINGWKF